MMRIALHRAGLTSSRRVMVPLRGLASSFVPSSFLEAKDFPSAVAEPITAVYEYNPNAVKLGVHLSKYGINLSKLAHEGKLEAVVGRDGEIQQTIQILSRRRKNNPCLIGEPGVGKTSIAEGLANLIAQGNVPESMKDKVIVSLDLASMIAGTKFRGEFEERLKGVLKEIESAGERIILFIDEMHTIVGAGGSEGAIDASNILKPSLARGQLRCLGTTTNDEYSKYIEKDAALARRFQSVYVPEPTEKDTVHILKGLRNKYEAHHRIRITDEAIEAAVKLAGRYLTSKRFPDKAIDLVDEACSRLRNKIESMPPRLLSCEREIDALHHRIEEALLQGKEAALKDELTLFRLSEDRQRLLQRWREQNALLGSVFEVQREISRLREGLKSLRHSSSVEGAKERVLQIVLDIQRNEALVEELYGKLERNDLDNEENTQELEQAKKDKFRNTLDARDMAEIIARSTGIPISSMLQDEDAKALLVMEQELQKQIVGQDEAIAAIAKCIRLSRAGLRFHDRPAGVFLMLGPTGVGKTELAKALCSFLFKDQPISSSFLRIDMSEYMERFSVSRLIGAPPGYVGYEEGGVLTDAVRRRPYQLILLDEFEKAHREVSNLLLQVFDEGRLTDSQGRVVDFRNTVIILTSNLGSDVLSKMGKDSDATENDDDGEEKANKPLNRSEYATKIVHQHFSPEFVNRLDEVIVFNSLSEEALMKICDIQLKKVQQLLQEKKIDFHISPSAALAVTRRGTDLQYGARPLKRFIQNDILSPLANQILEGSIAKGAKVFMSVSGDSQSFALKLMPDLQGANVITASTSEYGGSAEAGLEVSIVQDDGLL